VEVNEALLDSPEAINEDPYGEGWMVKVKPYDLGEIEELMDNEDYGDFIEKQSEK
jgi:glycine cleavage system H protein